MTLLSKTASHAEDDEEQRLLIALLSRMCGELCDDSPGARRSALTAWLTAHGAFEIPLDAWPLLDRLWQLESSRARITQARDLPGLSSNGSWTDRVSLWRGDITRLQADAIVNAANAGLTGCYVPFHRCVDNAIHTAAGPWLRQECERIMALRGRPEPTGTATATPAYFLPAGQVFHTVGPVVKKDRPTPEDEALLRQCYLACLAQAQQQKLNSIAFCAISTGIFGYPKRDAAACSLSAIRNHLSASAEPLHAILVAFSAEDEAVYREAVKLSCR